MIKQMMDFFRLQMQRYRYWPQYRRSLADPTKLLEIDPFEVEYKISNEDFESPPPKYGIVGGDWDMKKIEHTKSKYGTYKMLYEHFNNNKQWKETKKYQQDVEKIKSGENLGRLDYKEPNKKVYDEYLTYIDELYYQIKSNGYKSQNELNSENDFLNRSPGILNEAAVNIGRNGDIMKTHGGHRIIIAKLLEIDEIPVRVAVRHEHWQNKRYQIWKHGGITKDATLQKKLDHPDMVDLISNI